jgi:hypothetical protein
VAVRTRRETGKQQTIQSEGESGTGRIGREGVGGNENGLKETADEGQEEHDINK